MGVSQAQEGHRRPDRGAKIDEAIAALLATLRANATGLGDVGQMRRAADVARAAAIAASASAQEVSLPLGAEAVPAPAFGDARAVRRLVVRFHGGFHGGGWSLVSARTHAPIMSRLPNPARTSKA